MEPIEVVQNTLRWLKENPDRWCKHNGTDVYGRHCAIGAMGVVSDSSTAPLIAINLIKQSCNNTRFDGFYISQINDYYGYDAVIEVLEKTIADNAESMPKSESETKELVKV